MAASRAAWSSVAQYSSVRLQVERIAASGDTFASGPSQMLFQGAKCRLDLFERKRHAFAQGDRRSVVIDSDREELHVLGLS